MDNDKMIEFRRFVNLVQSVQLRDHLKLVERVRLAFGSVRKSETLVLDFTSFGQLLELMSKEQPIDFDKVMKDVRHKQNLKITFWEAVSCLSGLHSRST